MARKITDFDGTTAPPDSVNLYGNIKDDPGGTRANSKSNSDLQVFAQRMMANAGVVANSLPDNATNGFQLTTALNTMISRGDNALSALAAAAAGTNLPVGLYGVVDAGGLTHAVSAGYFFYNGQLVYFPGNNAGASLVGMVIVITVSNTDGLPTATASWMATVTDATHFPLSALVTYMYAPTAPTYSTGFVADGSQPIKCKRKGKTVSVEGKTNSGSPSSGIHTDTPCCTLPDASMFPRRVIYRLIIADLTQAYTSPGATTYVQIDTAGLITIMGSKGAFANNQAYFSFSFDTDM